MIPRKWFATSLMLTAILLSLAACDAVTPTRPEQVAVYESDWVSVGTDSDGREIAVRVRVSQEQTPTPIPTPEPTQTPTSSPTSTPAGYIIPDDVTTIDGGDFEPGDVLLVPSSRTAHLTFVGLRGTAALPITITNYGGQVVISDDFWTGIEFRDSEYFHLTGSGSPGVEYGFIITGFRNSGVYPRVGSRYLEVDHVEVSGAMAGFRLHTKVGEMPEGWVLENAHFHNNYAHDTQVGEGFYLGHRPGVDVPIDGLEVAYNRVERTGTEGIQVRQAFDSLIHHNVVISAGLRIFDSQTPNQSGAGLVIGPDSTGDWFNNIVIDSSKGISLQDAGDDVEIFNNLLINPGWMYEELTEDGGIRWFSRSEARIFNNTIINPYDYGVRGTGIQSGRIWNNVLAGSPQRYHVGGLGDGVQAYNNIEVETLEEAGFVGPGDYHLTGESIAVDAGVEPCPMLDLDGQERAGICDVGAFEYRD